MLEVHIDTTLRGKLAETLIAEAEKRGVQPVELLADIVDAVLSDNLVTAVLDDA